MMISEKQIMQLMTILYDSIKYHVSIQGMFSYDHDDRLKLYNKIINQQSEKLIEIKDE